MWKMMFLLPPNSNTQKHHQEIADHWSGRQKILRFSTFVPFSRIFAGLVLEAALYPNYCSWKSSTTNWKRTVSQWEVSRSGPATAVIAQASLRGESFLKAYLALTLHKSFQEENLQLLFQNLLGLKKTKMKQHANVWPWPRQECLR